MLQRTLVSQAQLMAGKTVRICGWVNTIRSQKRMQFLLVRDNTGLIQVANDRQANPDIAELIDTLTQESTIEVVGEVVNNPQVRLGGIEILPQSLTVDSLSGAQLPIDSESSLDARLDWRFLDLRRPENRLIFEVQTTAEAAMREFWLNNGFLEIHSPKLVGAPSESGAELFTLPYFEGQAYLAQSPQFYKQMAMASGFERVFEVGPVFRANPSFTSRHDTEFTSVDVEISWIQSHEDVMAFEERWLQFVIMRIAEKHSAQIAGILDLEVRVPSLPFPRISMSEAKRLLKQGGHPLSDIDDLDPEAERMVAAHINRTKGHDFVFVTDYPVEVRPFYHMRHPDDPTLTKSYDLLWQGLEVTTGAQREHRYDQLVRQVQEKGISYESLAHYLDFFKYGCPPHGGFGFGLSRMLMILLGKKNVREVTYLYRGPNRLTP